MTFLFYFVCCFPLYKLANFVEWNLGLELQLNRVVVELDMFHRVFLLGRVCFDSDDSHKNLTLHVHNNLVVLAYNFGWNEL